MAGFIAAKEKSLGVAVVVALGWSPAVAMVSGFAASFGGWVVVKELKTLKAAFHLEEYACEAPMRSWEWRWV